jgi:hypothetical protein
MAEKEIQFEIDKNGELFGFYEDIKDLLSEEERKKAKKNRKRVSYILPANPIKRVFFKAIRSLCDDESPLADWTRSWKCDWIVVIDGEVKGKFKDRQKAIEFEKEYLWKKFEKGNE